MSLNSSFLSSPLSSLHTHRGERFEYEHSFSIDAEDTGAGSEGSPAAMLARTVFALEGGTGPSIRSATYQYRLELSFSPSVVMSDDEEVAAPRFYDAPLELRVYDDRAEQYIDEGAAALTAAVHVGEKWDVEGGGGGGGDFVVDKDRLVKFLLWFLSVRKGAWSG